MNRWKRSSACLCVPVAAAGSGIADKTGEKHFSSSLLVRNWGNSLLELWEFMVSGNLLEYFLLLTASPVDDENSLFCFSDAAIVVKCPIKEMAVPSYPATLPLWPASTCVWGQGQNSHKDHSAFQGKHTSRVETGGRHVWSKVSATK